MIVEEGGRDACSHKEMIGTFTERRKGEGRDIERQKVEIHKRDGQTRR